MLYIYHIANDYNDLVSSYLLESFSPRGLSIIASSIITRKLCSYCQVILKLGSVIICAAKTISSSSNQEPATSQPIKISDQIQSSRDNEHKPESQAPKQASKQPQTTAQCLYFGNCTYHLHLCQHQYQRYPHHP